MPFLPIPGRHDRNTGCGCIAARSPWATPADGKRARRKVSGTTKNVLEPILKVTGARKLRGCPLIALSWLRLRGG